MRPVALFDFDNTLYDGFSYFDLLAKQTEEKLLNPEVLNEANIALNNYRNRRLPYEDMVVQLLDIYAEELSGKSYTQVAASVHRFYHNSPKIYDYSGKVFDLLRADHDLYLITAEPQFIAEDIVKTYNLNGYCSSRYEVADGVFTGKVTSCLATRHQKHNAIQRLLDGHPLNNSFAFGDSEGDIEMLAAVKYPVCVNASPGLLAHAAKLGWPCIEPDETEALVKNLLSKSL